MTSASIPEDMPSRTITSPLAGPVSLTVDAGPYAVRVRAGEVSHAFVTVRADGPGESAAEAVRTAVLEHDAHRDLRVTVPAPAGSFTAGGVSISSTGSGGSAIRVQGAASLNVVNIDGRTWINGVEVTGQGSAAAGTVRIEASVPTGSRVNLRTTTGSVTVTGTLAAARVRTDTGGIDVEHATEADLASDTGKLALGRAETARLATDVGNIRAGTVGTLTATTDVGNIRVELVRGHAELATDVGNIKAGYSGPKPAARSTIGKVKLHPVREPEDEVPQPRDAYPTGPEPEDAVPAGYRPRRAGTPWWRG